MATIRSGRFLADGAGKILLSSGNTHATDGGTGHAELNVRPRGGRTISARILETCTLYTSVEPCSMCSGGLYWAGVGRLVYGMSEARLAELTGDNPENLTMSLPCRKVLGAGQRKIAVEGPFPDLEDAIVHAHQGFW